jgi:hypothetical protein
LILTHDRPKGLYWPSLGGRKASKTSPKEAIARGEGGSLVTGNSAVVREDLLVRDITQAFETAFDDGESIIV